MSTAFMRMKAAIDRSIATCRYQKTRDRTLLDQLGIDPATIKRPRGRPPKTSFTDRQIVQLVWKQKYQAGRAFSNEFGGDVNQCFVAVANAQHRNVGEIRKAWNRVPAAERKQIGAWLFDLLHEHGGLHPRFKKKSE